jgi:decaprenylphospho-beta-D-erythro-pentofuranosid-2-ulose 2-reductase
LEIRDERGRALARRFAVRGDRLFLMGRDPDELQRSAEDLAVRAGSDTRPDVAWCDLEHPDGFDDALDAAWAALGQVDCVVITAGMFATQDDLEAQPALALRMLTANHANTVYLCERVRVRLLAAGGGTLCVFSSVAGDRGRKTVGLYGSSKAGLSHYLDSLDHKYRVDGLVTVCVKPGFVRTGMTDGLKPPPFAGEPDAVAEQVIKAIDRRSPLVYAPSIWRLVMLVIRHLPRFVMRRVGF